MGKNYFFQEEIVKECKDRLAEEKYIFLCGDEKTGKSNLVTKIRMNECDNYYLDGKNSLKEREYGVFVAKGLNKDFFTEIGNTISLLAEGTEKIKVAANSLKYLLDYLNDGKKEEFHYIENKIKLRDECKGMKLFIVDHIKNIDEKSLLFIYYLMKSKNNKFKFVIVLDNHEDYVIFKQLKNKKNTIKMTCISKDVFEKNNINVLFYEEYKTIPIYYFVNNFDIKEKGLEKTVTDKLYSIFNKNDTYYKIFCLLYLYNRYVNRKGIKLELLAELININYFELVQILDTIDDELIISFDEEKGIIKLNIPSLDIYSDIIQKRIFSNNLNMIIDYIEQKYDYYYETKFLLYKSLDKTDKAIINAVLESSNQAKKGNYNDSMKFFDYLNRYYYCEFNNFFYTGIMLYCEKRYGESYVRFDAIIQECEKCKYNYMYIYDIDIIAEVMYLRALSLTRMISQGENTEILSYLNENIEELEKIISKSVNFEQKLRLKEALLYLHNDYEDRKFSDKEIQKSKYNVKKEYDEIFEEYSDIVKRANTNNVDYWNYRISMFLSKVQMIEVNDYKVLEQSYRLLSNNKYVSISEYIMIICNYASALYWEGQYKKALTIINKGLNLCIKFQKNDLIGIITQTKIIICISLNPYKISENSKIINKAEKEIYNNVIIFSKMHEEIICRCNNAVFMAYIGDLDECYRILMGEKNKIEKENKYGDEYDKYLIYTNFAAILYLNGDLSKSIEYEKLAYSMSDNIKYFDKKMMKKRHVILIDLYSRNKSILNNPFIPIETTENSRSKNHHPNNYLRLFLFSDVNYWSN